MRRVVIAGASKGVGAALAAHLAAAGDEVISLSRSAPAAGQWHRCDLAEPGQIEVAAGQITGRIDALIFVAGVWEAEAFSPGYSFAGSSADEMTRILAVNLQAPLLLARALLGPLRGGRIVLVGSASGLDHIGTPEVAYNASKAGLRGAAQAMAVALKGEGIAVAIVNPGDIASAEVLAAKREGAMRADGSLPMADVLGAIDYLLSLSAATAFCEIDLLAQRG